MKKFAVLLVVTFLTVLVLSSCNKQACPAYNSKVDVKKTEHIG
jgi:hypothetical protein